MMTKTFNLALNDQTANAIRKIALCIPCFISLTPSADNSRGDYTISARIEDWDFVQRLLNF